MKRFEFDPEHTFFTSDTHFGHANIINLCKRPFKDVNHMNDMLVENWNNVVTDDDTVFHLGDFAFGGSWSGNNNKFLWTLATDRVFKDCFIPTTTYEKGPLQFEIDEQLNTTWYKK